MDMLDRKHAERFDDIWIEQDDEWDAEGLKTRTLKKLHDEQPVKRRWRKKTMMVMLAAIIAVMGTISFGADRDWDIRFAEFIGASEVMTDLPGGYKAIGERQTVDGITLTVAKSIGDQNSQWIQVDTNLPFEGKYEAWEIFAAVDVEFLSGIKAFGTMVLPFDADGELAFLVEILDAEGINRAEMELSAELKDGGRFNIKWKNYYAENTHTFHPMKVFSASSKAGEYKVMLDEISISPVSIRAKGWTMPEFGERRTDGYVPSIHVDSVTLQTGEVVDIAKANLATISGWSSVGNLDCYVPLASASEEARTINGNDIVSVIISGEEFILNEQ